MEMQDVQILKYIFGTIIKEGSLKEQKFRMVLNGVNCGVENMDAVALCFIGMIVIDHFENRAKVHEQWPNKVMISSEICRGDIFNPEIRCKMKE